MPYGKDSAPRRDWESSRLGASPPEALGKLRGDVKDDIFGAYGIPSSIHGTGGSAREKLNDLVAAESADDITQRDKLSADLKAMETELRAAIELDGAASTSPESREWAGLNSRFDLADMFTGVMEHRASSGVIAEVQKERGLAANAIPTELLMVEHRAVTPAPTDVGQSRSQITGYVFPQSVAAFLGISSDIVPVGDASFPVLTSDPAAGTPAENAPQAETTGAFTADALSPSRIQASFFWSRESAARMAGMGDALRDALQGGIADKLDKEILQGTNGLFTGIILADHNRAASSDYAHYVAELLYARVDGQSAFDLAGTVRGGSHNCADEVWEDPSKDIRLFGVIRRDGPEWKDLYDKRQAIERVFKSMKESRRLERHCVRGLRQIRLHAMMSALAFQATALVRVLTGEADWMRWMVRKIN